MLKNKSYPTLSEIYRRAWESCVALWPLFIVRFVFVVVNFGAIFLCLFLVCWPFIQTLWKVFKDSEGRNYADVIKGMDFTSFVPDVHWILMAVGMALLFIIWWVLLGALFDSGMYARLRGYQENEEPFSIRNYFLNGIQYMFPMIGLWIVWLVIFMAVLLAGFLLVLFLVILFKALSIPWWFGIILGIPGGFASVVVMIGLGAYASVAGAYLMEGKGVVSALGSSFRKCWEDYGRVVWGILLVWVIYIVFSIAFQTVMEILGHIPLLGVFFILIEFLANLVLSIAIWVFMPALAVAFSLEKES